MQLTRQQASLLHAVRSVIQAEWKLSIGYSCPAGSFVDESNDFIIWEEPIKQNLAPEQEGENNWQPSLIHKLDFERLESGIVVRERPNPYPLHEEEVIKFWERLQQALLTGEIYHEPGITRVFDYRGEKITVDCNKLPDGSFSFWVSDSNYKSGFTRTLEQLQEQVERNKHPANPEMWEEFDQRTKDFIVKEDFKENIALQVAQELLTLGKKKSS